MTTRAYGWRRDIPDHRDVLAIPSIAPADLPAVVDLRPRFPVVPYDQGQLGSCTANALAALVEFERLRDGRPPDFIPSRLFIYFNERRLEHTVSVDAGAMLRDGIKSLARWGVCREKPTWPYEVGSFAVPPPPAAYAEAKAHRVVGYQRVAPTVAGVRAALAAGSPVAFGFSVYSSFESAEVARTGLVPLPKRDEQLLGGHAVAAMGYDHGTRHLIVRNSWGPAWGQAGHFLLPYEFLEQRLAADFWQVQIVP